MVIKGLTGSRRSTRAHVKLEQSDDTDALVTFQRSQLNGASASSAEPRITDKDSVHPNANVTPNSSMTVNNDNDDTISVETSMNTSNTFEHTSSTVNAMQALGEKSRLLIKAVQELEALRIDTTLPSLPKFVVVGDQSHGKSSIIEAVCDVTLPRAAGTCTRCPFLITTSASSPDGAWSCKVSLVERYISDGGAANRAFGGTDKTFAVFGWKDNGVEERKAFDTVYDKTHLENVLRRAQLAILNPEIPPDTILRSQHLDIGEGHRFSPNIISLEISAPHLPELALYDLPGAISNDPHGDEDLPKFVRALIVRYIKEEKAQILLAVSADQDVHCSQAKGYIDKCKAGSRSTGVFTKADRLVRENIAAFGSILNDEEFQLGNGWFVVKNPSQQELNVGLTHEDARAKEREFFKSEPWTTELAKFTDRFGTENLREALSHALVGLIKESLPEFSDRVEAELQRVRAELATYPEPVKAPMHTVVSEITKLTHTIAAQLKPGSHRPEYRNGHRNLLTELKEKLDAARPEVVMTTPGHVVPVMSSGEEDDDEEDMTPTPKTPARPQGKVRKGNNGEPLRTPHRVQEEPARKRSTPLNRPKLSNPGIAGKRLFKLDQVRKEYELGQCTDLGESNPCVTINLTMQCLTSWRSLIENTLDAVTAHTKAFLSKNVKEMLATRRDTMLFREVDDVLQKLTTDLMDVQRHFMQQHMDCELHEPVTQQLLKMGEQAKAIEQTLRDKRVKARQRELLEILQANGKTVKQTELDKAWADAGPDPWGEELSNIAKPLAYYDIAAVGLMDVLAKHLRFGLHHALDTQMEHKLSQRLRTQDEEHCAQLLADNPEREAKRQELKVLEGKLIEARAKLQQLNRFE